jgi:hypothetical protein
MRVRHEGVRTEIMGADIWTIVRAEARGTRVSIPTGHRKSAERTLAIVRAGPPVSFVLVLFATMSTLQEIFVMHRT